MILAVLAAITVTLSPPAPRVGDLITLDFPAPAVVDASPDYEVVSASGRRVVVRTFAPKAFAVSGTVGGNTRFSRLVVPVKSVLKPKDDLAPAPLVPPLEQPYPSAPFVSIAIAALCAIAAWALVWWRTAQRALAPARAPVRPEERFRRAVVALRANHSHPRRWTTLADETRIYLAATRPHLGSELTTSEVIPRLAEDERVVAEILRQGDMEKFSPARKATGDFDTVATTALELVREREEMREVA
jgi:hypothetical protein